MGLLFPMENQVGSRQPINSKQMSGYYLEFLVETQRIKIDSFHQGTAILSRMR